MGQVKQTDVAAEDGATAVGDEDVRKHLRDDDGNLIMCHLDLAGATNQNI